mgnify:FL=1
MFPLLILLASLLLGWALWFVIELVRYIASGEYEMDERMRDFER